MLLVYFYILAFEEAYISQNPLQVSLPLSEFPSSTGVKTAAVTEAWASSPLTARASRWRDREVERGESSAQSQPQEVPWAAAENFTHLIIRQLFVAVKYHRG